MQTWTGQRFGWIAIVLVGSILTAERTHGQYQRIGAARVNAAQFTEVTPPVEVPAPIGEGAIGAPQPMATTPSAAAPLGETTYPGATALAPTSALPMDGYPMDGYSMDGVVIDGDALPVYDQVMGTGACGVDPEVYSSGTWFRRGRWYLGSEFVMYRLEQNTPVFLYQDTTTFQGFADSNDVFRFEPGLRMTLGTILGRDDAGNDHVVDASYLGALDWNASAEFTAADSQSLGALLGNRVPGMASLDSASYSYASKLDSFEVNYRIQTRPGRDQLALQPNGRWVRHASSSGLRTVFGGVRYINAPDRFNMHGFRDLVPATDTDAEQPSVTTDYFVSTENSMFGGQIGLELMEKYDRWYWSLQGKVAGLANRAELVDSIVSDDGTSDRPVRKLEDTTGTFVAEVNFAAAYYFRPHTAIKAGYNLLYFSSVARAADNLRLGATRGTLVAEGNSFYQGLSVGLETIW
ncbi:MAG: BBP7 family outer membrane beta-barrel protein [Pirellulaceae bacterium]|nr:BBP7 family outer membrane beta-barrel protein [Planctomycetales bacterium]